MLSRSLSPLRPKGEVILVDERYSRYNMEQGPIPGRLEGEYMSREEAEHILRNRERSPQRFVQEMKMHPSPPRIRISHAQLPEYHHSPVRMHMMHGHPAP